MNDMGKNCVQDYTSGKDAEKLQEVLSTVARIFSETLHVEHCSDEYSLQELGGDSIAASVIAIRIFNEFKFPVEKTLYSIDGNKNVRSIAEEVAQTLD